MMHSLRPKASLLALEMCSRLVQGPGSLSPLSLVSDLMWGVCLATDIFDLLLWGDPYHGLGLS